MTPNKQMVTIEGTKIEITVTEKIDGFVSVKLYNKDDMSSSMVTLGGDDKVRITSYNVVRIVGDTVIERA